MAEHIFLFAVSPVQSYIAQARKTQDLYAGSMILSHLCREAFKATGLPVERLLFPRIDLTSKEQSLPNRFVAIVKEEELAKLEGKDEKEKLHNLGTQTAKATEKAFKKIAYDVFWLLKGSVPKKCRQEVRHQVKCFLDINWLFLPYQQADYCNIYPRLERLLQGVKQVRAFQPLPEQGRKCAICGERNVKVYRKSSTDGKTECLLKTKLFTTPEQVLVVEEESNSPIRKKFLDPGEGLCAVCYMKRNAEKAFGTGYDEAFPSTSRVALFDALDRLKPPNGKSVSDYDSDQITQLALTHKHSPAQAEQEARKYKQTRELGKAKELAAALKEQKVDFGPYYALLIFDGDLMGDWLSGKWLQDKQQLEPFHRALSARLADFAQHAKNKCLTWPCGRAVYAGGDDFLGFVNIASLFDVMGKLRNLFDEKVNTPLFEESDDFKLNEPNRRMSFSAGVAVAYYKLPLGEVLKWARQMEREAKKLPILRLSEHSFEALKKKEIPDEIIENLRPLDKRIFSSQKDFLSAVQQHIGDSQLTEDEKALILKHAQDIDHKDAFAIAVLKHAGAIQQAAFHWRKPDDPSDTRLTTKLCQDVMDPILKGNFSTKFFTVLHKEFQRLILPDKQMPFEQLVQPEVRRLIKRACEMPDAPAKGEAVEELTRAVMNVYDRSKNNFENLLSAFDILDFFIRKDTQ